MYGEPHRINYIQSPLVSLNEFRNLVTDHLAILLEAGTGIPGTPRHRREPNPSVRKAPFHLGRYGRNIRHVTTDDCPRLSRAYPVFPPCPLPPSPFFIEPVPTSTSTDFRVGRFSHYAVRKGRTTGIFTTWSECFNSTNGVPNQFRGFNSLHDAQQYLLQPA